MKAARNRIRQHKRRPRIRMVSSPMSIDTWVRDRFVSATQYPGAQARLQYARNVAAQSHVRERFRILRWIFRLLRR